MPDRRESMAGYVAQQKTDYDTYFTIPDYTAADIESVIKIPAHNIVCPTCNGNGKHVNPSIDSNGITQSEMEELGDDFREDYFAGLFDIPCAECHGKRVVLEENENLTPAQEEALRAYYYSLNEEAQEIYYKNKGYEF